MKSNLGFKIRLANTRIRISNFIVFTYSNFKLWNSLKIIKMKCDDDFKKLFKLVKYYIN